jgi:tRNA dimethylallyltransferase
VSKENPGIAILGPTASGKSRLAVSLSLHFHGEIVNCDAFQIYKGMDIGTAKISPAERLQIRHHMLDLQNPDRDFSAGDYQRQAREVIRAISDRGHLPFVVGGTGFYLRALIDGLFEGPARSEELRERMRHIIQRKGPRVLHRALQHIDPECAARIAQMDAERIIRAYEVYLVSGKSMTWWQQQPRDALQGFRWLKIGINLPRDRLYERINQRVDDMFRNGLLDETRELLKQFSPHSQAFKAIGYRQAAACIEGRMTESEAVEETKMHSRRYAKRQLTWFRADPAAIWLDGSLEPEELQRRAADLVADFLQTWESSEN